MRIRTATAAGILAALTLTGCSSSGDSTSSDTTKTPHSATTAELTEEQQANAREAAGLPPTPKPADWAAYIQALNAIDADIVHGKEDKAVRRGIDSCSGFKRYPDDSAQQVKFTGMRFTSPTHPEGRDTATAKKILAAAHKHICPDF